MRKSYELWHDDATLNMPTTRLPVVGIRKSGGDWPSGSVFDRGFYSLKGLVFQTKALPVRLPRR